MSKENKAIVSGLSEDGIRNHKAIRIEIGTLLNKYDSILDSVSLEKDYKKVMNLFDILTEEYFEMLSDVELTEEYFIEIVSKFRTVFSALSFGSEDMEEKSSILKERCESFIKRMVDRSFKAQK